MDPFYKQFPQMFFKIGVLKHFAIFTENTPMLESLFNKAASLGLQLN